MLCETFTGGPAATNGYLVADQPGGRALVIDAPQGTAAAMVAQARAWQTPIGGVINTHGHWDHVLDNAALQRLTQAPLAIHRADAPMLHLPQTRWFGLDFDLEPCEPASFLEETAPVMVGRLCFRVLHCPGHSPGSVALFEPQEHVVFVGDVLFAGTVGRTDLPGGDPATLRRSIRDKLLPLGDNVRVLAGHGPATTIGAERRHNPFLR